MRIEDFALTSYILGLLKLSYCKISTYLPIFSPNSRNEDGSEKIKHNFGEKKENLPRYDSIKFLDLSHVRFKANSEETPSETTNRYLSRLLVMCPSLKKLSLQGLRISNQIFTHYISAKKTLTHLNLFACSGIILVKTPKSNFKYEHTYYCQIFCIFVLISRILNCQFTF